MGRGNGKRRWKEHREKKKDCNRQTDRQTDEDNKSLRLTLTGFESSSHLLLRRHWCIIRQQPINAVHLRMR